MLAFARRLLRPVRSLDQVSEQCDDLTALANRYGSDKGNQHFDQHCYTRIYSELFRELRTRPIRLLEIGLLHPCDSAWRAGNVHTAPSLMMWSHYFPYGRIFGFDIADFSVVSIPRVSIYRGDASSRQDLGLMISSSGGRFDIIIDDASHASRDQQIALGTLFEHVSPGGLYIIEDLQVSDKEVEAPKTREFLRKLGLERTARSPYLTDSEARYLEINVERIAFYDSLSPGGEQHKYPEALAVVIKKSLAAS